MDNQGESVIEKKRIELLVSKDYQWNSVIRRKVQFNANLHTIIKNPKKSEIMWDKVLVKSNNCKNLYFELLNSTEWPKDNFQTTTSISKEAFNQIVHYRKFLKECVLG